ncbi:hypothetical protein [Synechococcus sp. CBW1006]|uniref:hypothetical protein n=1 Tax=Synechococcus sp. CBW1006 TaxID=1353138 RepID=UPI0018CCEBE2|nr:hypothetical protein [Synechococcus sp. CBW1006]QPN66542.1 hypothetical protein H8F26_17765 [Synechococcus sp. CBW1006]
MVLPPAGEAEVLANRQEVWRHLALELAEQVGAASSSCSCALWISCADGLPPPDALSGAVAELVASLPDLTLVNSTTCLVDQPRWLLASQVVVLLGFEPGPDGTGASVDRLRNERLNGALPQDTTIALTLHRHHDGVRHARYAGATPLGADQTHRPPARALAASATDWLEARQRLTDTAPCSAFTPQGWSTALCVAWALERSRTLLRRSDRRLLIKALALATLLVLLAPLLHQLTTRLIPGVVLLAVGALGLRYQPLRQRAQRWWCLAQALWVQDTWHRFGLADGVAEQLPLRQPLDSGQLGQLRQLLHAHDLALALADPPPPWGRAELADAIEGLEQHCDLVAATIRYRLGEQRLMVVPALVCGVLLLGVAVANAVVIKQAILAAATALIALWLHRPLPLVRRERLVRHLRALQAELPELRRGLSGADLSEPNLRASLVASIHRIGAEWIDLAKDALEASASTWTLSP